MDIDLYMIEVKAGDGTVQITLATEGMSAEHINDFITCALYLPIDSMRS